MNKHIIPKQVAIDFDGVFCCNDSPYIGQEVPGAIEITKRLKEAGHTLILLTMRHDELLDEAVQWLKERGIEFDFINMNSMHETGARKVYFHYLIDDHCCGVPLTFDPLIHKKPFVDWYRVKNLLLINKYL